MLVCRLVFMASFVFGDPPKDIMGFEYLMKFICSLFNKTALIKLSFEEIGSRKLLNEHQNIRFMCMISVQLQDTGDVCRFTKIFSLDFLSLEDLVTTIFELMACHYSWLVILKYNALNLPLELSVLESCYGF